MNCFRCSNNLQRCRVFSDLNCHFYCDDCYNHLVLTKHTDSKCFMTCENCSSGFIETLFNLKICKICGVNESKFNCDHHACMSCYVERMYPSIEKLCFGIYNEPKEYSGKSYILSCIKNCEISNYSIPAELFLEYLEQNPLCFHQNREFVIEMIKAFLPLFNGIEMDISKCKICKWPFGKLSQYDSKCIWCNNINYL